VDSVFGQHFGAINGTVPLNLSHTTHIAIASGPHNTSILAFVWSRFNGTVPLMTPKCCSCFCQQEAWHIYIHSHCTKYLKIYTKSIRPLLKKKKHLHGSRGITVMIVLIIFKNIK